MKSTGVLARYDTLLSSGTLIDGSGRSAYEADVAIKGDRIVAIGKLRGARAAEEIDIHGKCLAPGFIDTHTHDDQACMAAATMEPKISQGVTTVVVGNCGVSLAPLDHPPTIPEPINLLGEPEDFRFRDFRSYFDAVDEARPSTNVIALVGHSSLRVAAMRDLQRPATPAELDTMLGLLDDAMRAGAGGLSTGVFYPLGRAADSGEVVPLVSMAASTLRTYATSTMPCLMPCAKRSRRHGSAGRRCSFHITSAPARATGDEAGKPWRFSTTLAARRTSAWTCTPTMRDRACSTSISWKRA